MTLPFKTKNAITIQQKIIVKSEISDDLLSICTHEVVQSPESKQYINVIS